MITGIATSVLFHEHVFGQTEGHRLVETHIQVARYSIATTQGKNKVKLRTRLQLVVFGSLLVVPAISTTCDISKRAMEYVLTSACRRKSNAAGPAEYPRAPRRAPLSATPVS